MAEMSSLGTESFNAPAIVPFKSMTPVMASPGVGAAGSMENTGGEGLSIMESMKESLSGMAGPMAAMTGIFVIIKEGISKLVEFARETLNFEKKQNDSLEDMADVMADDLDLEETKFDAEQDQARMDSRDENIDDNDFKAESNDTTEGGGMLGSIKGAAGKLNPANLGEKGKILLFGAIAAGLSLAAGKINSVVGPALKLINEKVVPAFKRGMDVILKDIGPVFDRVFGALQDALSGLVTLVQGIFELDFGKIASGLKKIFVEGLPKAISALGTAFFSAVEGLLTFLGVDPDGLVMKSIRFIKESFLKFPENIANLITGISTFVVEKFTAAKTFITETIPEKFTEMQTKFIDGVKNIISFVVDPIVELKDNIVEFVDTGVENIKSGVIGVVNKIKDVFTGFTNKLKGMANAVIDVINKIPGIEFDKFKMTPLSTDVEPAVDKDADKAAGVKLGDAATAEEIALQDRAKAEGDERRYQQDVSAFMARETTYSGFYNNPYNTKDYFRDKSQIGTDRALEGDMLEEGFVDRKIMESVKESQALRAQGLLLPDAERALAAFEKANAMPPTVVANSTKQGDNINQTQISAGELSSDHSDMTAKHLANSVG